MKGKKEYLVRLNRVTDYIDANLTEDLDLEKIASVASFSKYHFHRIFSSITGEPLGQYIQRLRLEKAAGEVGSRKDVPITEIAMNYNFSSSAVFSRSFRERFGMSPSEWRRGGWKEHSKGCKLQSSRYQQISNSNKAVNVSIDYYGYTNNQWRIEMKSGKTKLDYTVEVREMGVKHLAYVRHKGPYAGDGELFERLYSKLMKWAVPRDLFIPGKSGMLTIYHDSPDITEEENLRISACLTVPENTETSGEIGYMDIPAGKYAVAVFRIGMDNYGNAWNSVFGDWLPESGYECTDGFCYELYLNDPEKDPEKKHEIAIHIPVKPV